MGLLKFAAVVLLYAVATQGNPAAPAPVDPNPVEPAVAPTCAWGEYTCWTKCHKNKAEDMVLKRFRRCMAKEDTEAVFGTVKTRQCFKKCGKWKDSFEEIKCDAITEDNKDKEGCIEPQRGGKGHMVRPGGNVATTCVWSEWTCWTKRCRRMKGEPAGDLIQRRRRYCVAKDDTEAATGTAGKLAKRRMDRECKNKCGTDYSEEQKCEGATTGGIIKDKEGCEPPRRGGKGHMGRPGGNGKPGNKRPRAGKKGPRAGKKGPGAGNKGQRGGNKGRGPKGGRGK